MESIAFEVAHDIRDRYTVGYRSSTSASTGGYRVIRVEASAPRHGKLIVRTRKGYYAKAPAPQHTQAERAVGQ